jgi:uncharacterized membrane protein
MNRNALDLVVVGALAAIVMALTCWAPSPGAARALAALPLVLFLPGYAITAALFPSGALGAAERLLFSVGLSLAAAALGGLLLHWASLGLAAASWAALLGNLTLLACLAALLRRRRLPAGETPRRAPRLTLPQGAQLGMAALLVCGALLLAREGAAAPSGPGFTQLWALPTKGGSQDSVRLGLSNHETRSMRYRLQVVAGGATVDTWPLIALEPGQEWQAIVALPAQPSNSTVEAVL